MSASIYAHLRCLDTHTTLRHTPALRNTSASRSTSTSHGSAAHFGRKNLLMAPAQQRRRPALLPMGEAAGGSADAERAFTWLDANAVLVLALLICGLFAAAALHVLLQCAFRVTGRAWYGANNASATPRAGAACGGRAAVGAGRWRSRAWRTRRARAGRVVAVGVRHLPRRVRARREGAVLPRCSHGFHALCIDRWLAARPTCPHAGRCRSPSPTSVQLAAECARPAPVVAVVRVIIHGGAGRRVEI
ncbi:hypothetical protein ZWY2020_010350 [Hordeum vulgare]|nr:hypothetical protein ZWY2020_010350 [Hordeum vulgare]